MKNERERDLCFAAAALSPARCLCVFLSRSRANALLLHGADRRIMASEAVIVIRNRLAAIDYCVCLAYVDDTNRVTMHGIATLTIYVISLCDSNIRRTHRQWLHHGFCRYFRYHLPAIHFQFRIMFLVASQTLSAFWCCHSSKTGYTENSLRSTIPYWLLCCYLLARNRNLNQNLFHCMHGTRMYRRWAQHEHVRIMCVEPFSHKDMSHIYSAHTLTTAAAHVRIGFNIATTTKLSRIQFVYIRNCSMYVWVINESFLFGTEAGKRGSFACVLHVIAISTTVSVFRCRLCVWTSCACVRVL